MLKITTKAELQSAISKFALATSSVADAREIQRAAKALDSEDLLPADLAPAAPDPQLAKALREVAILKLSPEAKSHFDGLDEAGQTAFLAKSADDQRAEIEAANSADPVVYKCKDGTLIRKSDGTAAAMLAKRADEQAAELAKLRGDLAGSSIEKRAVEEFPNVAKSVAVDMLKSIDQVGAESETGKAMLKSLRTLNTGQSRLFKALGSTEGEDDQPGDVEKARADYDAKVSEIAKRDNIGRPEAMSKARVEAKDLFEKAYPETVQMAEESAEEARQHGE